MPSHEGAASGGAQVFGEALTMSNKTRQVRVGNVLIGGGAPVAVQSMTTTYTRDVKSTVEQIKRLEDVGCELVRVAVPEMEDAVVLGEIKKQISIPLVADIHYNPNLALEAIRQGIDKVRINPGNLLNGRESLVQIARAAKERDIAMRIGVNSGSIDALDKQAQMQRIQVRLRADGTLERSDPAEARRREREHLAERMVSKALEYISWCEEIDFHNIIVSLKSSTVLTAVEAYRRFSERSDYPIHLGITEAGTLVTGAVKSSVGMGLLLADGIGDTMRVSLSAEPEEEIPVAYEILKSLELRNRGVTFVSCPSCGRVEIDVISVANEVEKRLTKVQTPIQVAVMGCVVNGPGESRDADVGLAGGKGKGVIFRKGQVVKTVPEDQFLDAVLKEVASLLPEAEAKLVYPEGGIKDIAGTHRTRDEGMNLPILPGTRG
ncbi:4-hydroxy-3-methylbut-2-en-1-yl diphosphate synthase (flavodoxin) [Ktedonospora formicarum]|uniref:4-hydroxy-3-methylbut-2-en-1-yl diphosphate synthase (flavodoxin) n=2 Tax=Ktedonospora formicarum TaxID=2778364 RepID=A0A8J3I1B2_9CHLR|nr:4-hydroxy-3-methylbut-2-en-1-yl diphosphate synthase (flavodoxin) [Ktedonospora formicarum]